MFPSSLEKREERISGCDFKGTEKEVMAQHEVSCCWNQLDILGCYSKSMNTLVLAFGDEPPLLRLLQSVPVNKEIWLLAHKQ